MCTKLDYGFGKLLKCYRACGTDETLRKEKSSLLQINYSFLLKTDSCCPPCLHTPRSSFRHTAPAHPSHIHTHSPHTSLSGWVCPEPNLPVSSSYFNLSTGHTSLTLAQPSLGEILLIWMGATSLSHGVEVLTANLLVIWLSTPFVPVFSEHWVKWLCSRHISWGWATFGLLFSTRWPVVEFCNSLHKRQEEVCLLIRESYSLGVFRTQSEVSWLLKC